MTEHSPAPWTLNEAGTSILATGDCGRFTVCEIKNRHRPEQQANKQVILAAPDMLDELQAGTEAAQCVLNNWTQGNLAAAVNSLEEWMNGAKVAIAKATGGAA